MDWWMDVTVQVSDNWSRALILCALFNLWRQLLLNCRLLTRQHFPLKNLCLCHEGMTKLLDLPWLLYIFWNIRSVHLRILTIFAFCLHRQQQLYAASAQELNWPSNKSENQLILKGELFLMSFLFTFTWKRIFKHLGEKWGRRSVCSLVVAVSILIINIIYSPFLTTHRWATSFALLFMSWVIISPFQCLLTWVVDSCPIIIINWNRWLFRTPNFLWLLHDFNLHISNAAAIQCFKPAWLALFFMHSKLI